ncbi:MAG: ATP-binding protein [Candidatus Omnitrophota bacterium]
MQSNKEYFHKYFSVHELLVEKDCIAQKLWDCDGNTGFLAATHYQAKRDIEALSALIREEEERFKKEVQEAEAAGIVFDFEVFARSREMSDFEKRTVLFFLYLDLFCFGHVAFPRRKLAAILDCESTAFSRSRTLLDLFKGSPLFKKELIVEVQSSNEIRLAVPVRDMLRKLVCGDTTLPIEETDNTTDKDDCDTGRVCEPEYAMADVSLPGHVKEQVLMHLNTHSQLSELGIMDKVRRGRGLCLLFYGPPGTGKSMFSHAIAGHLGKRVLQASAAKIMSKYVGQAEKNIASLFKTAKEKDCVLCLDEADSFLYNRSGAHSSWEVTQTNALLEEIERFDGVFIMTTNLESLLDPALERRVALRVRLDVPDHSIRAEIWQKHIPVSVRCGEDINWSRLALEYSFSGGYIKNAVLSALRHMLSRQSQILDMEDLIFGAESELRGQLRSGCKGPIGFAMRG